jgi:hypothetical protein
VLRFVDVEGSRLTELAERAGLTKQRAAGTAIFEEIEERWAERYGAERVAGLRELLEEIVSGDRIPALPAG